jgi:predicted nuclease with TOPRIM domain
MPGTKPSHVFGWVEATLDEKLEGLHDWCNILTAKLKTAEAETAALRERIKKLESEASVRIEIRGTRDFEKGLELSTRGPGSHRSDGAKRPS